MEEWIRVCHVVNSVRDNSMPGELATTQASLPNIDTVGVLAWSTVEPFDSMNRVDTVSLGTSNAPYVTPSQYARAKSVLSGYDIVHTHHPHSGFYAKIIAKRIGLPVVQTEHNNHSGFTAKGRIANGVTNLLADAVVCVSESVQESFRRWEKLLVNHRKISVINNGINSERIEAARGLDWSIDKSVDIDPEAVVVGSAGMLTEQKAHEVLIEAVDRANAESEQPIELVISGDGELREQLERQIENADHSDRLHLLGFLPERDQVYKMMHEIDIYAMPSRWEGFCVAALEGLATGNACVFSDIPEFKQPFDGIARFHTVDDPQSLCRELCALVETPDRELGERGKRAVLDKYTIDKTAEEYANLYSKQLGRE